MNLLLLLLTSLSAAPSSIEIVWSARMGEDQVILTHVRASHLDAYRLAYLINQRARAAQVIPDEAARAQTREYKAIFTPSVLKNLAAPIGRCRSPLSLASDDLCLDQIDRATGSRLSRWWLKNRALLGV